jgi:tetratricopeptide (TPR) repeat protein
MMNNPFVFLFLSFLLFSSMGHAQNKAKAHLKLTEGRQEFLKNNYWGALALYREAADMDSENALIAYRIGECQYALKHYPIAKKYFEEVKADNPDLDPELPLMLGLTYHRLAELEKAKESYREYRNNQSESRGRLVNIKALIDQCDYAADMMNNAMNVEIQNLGISINSRYDDYAPSVTADGRLLVFTSRRSSGLSNDVDVNGDYRYFEDIYFSEWDDVNSQWGKAERFSENVNTPTHDAVLSLSPDGKELYVYKNDADRAGDIFKSTFNSVWSEPKKLPRPINSSYFESSVSMTSDGNTLYFISERPTGLGRGDIYVSQRVSSDSWSKPQNLGEVINTIGDEKFVFIHPNGSTLFFASNGHLTMGSYDIFRSELVNGSWTVPINLGYPINTVNEESTFSMTADNSKLLISAEYEDSMGERDIYEVDLSRADILHSLSIDSKLLASSSNIVIFGQVTESTTDKPLVFIDIEARHPDTDALLFVTRTDQKGLYEVNIPRAEECVLFLKDRNGDIKRIRVNLKQLDLLESEYREDIQM